MSELKCPSYTTDCRTHTTWTICTCKERKKKKMINLILAWHNTLDMPLDSTLAVGVKERVREQRTKIIFLSPEHDDFYSQYECSYNKNTNFSPFFFRWPSGWELRSVCGQVCVFLYAWERDRVCECGNDSTRHRPQVYITRQQRRPKTSSKLINSETKVEHARKINIKKVAKALSYTFIFIYYVWTEY